METLRDGVVRDLSDNVLPFWMRRVLDRDRGFLGFVTEDGRTDPQAPLGGVLAARLLWTLSAVTRQLGDETCRAAADRLHAWMPTISPMKIVCDPSW